MGKSLLIYMTGFFMIIGMQFGNMNRIGSDAAQNLYESYERQMADNIASGGLEYALTKLTANPSWTGENDRSLSDGSFDVTVTDRSDLGTDMFEITSKGLFGDAADSVRAVVEVKMISNRFSRFSYFSNYEPVIWFYTLDTLFGPVHTNGTFHMSGTPAFYGMVSSVGDDYETYGYTDPSFEGGTDFGRSPISLNPDFTALQQAAFDGGHTFSGNTLYMNILNNGTYNYKLGSSGSWYSRSYPDNGVIYSERDIYIEGTVDGQLTVSSQDDIYITDNIMYAVDPRTNPDSDDLLGLIAYDDIIIQNNSANRDICRIDAAMLARVGSFKAENIDFQPATRLEVMGGIVQERRGAVGRLGDPPSGYKKYYEYDERMEFVYPPFFPIAPNALDNLNRKAYITLISWVE